MHYLKNIQLSVNDLKMDNKTQPIEIDLVYLWVNGNDPQWRAKHDAVTGNTPALKSLDGEGRYTDNDELKYSLRSIEMYAPWIHKIFIVTDNQKPEWLDTTHPKVQIVDHTEIMPAESLPCFNSSVIEHFLPRIPDLAEHFLFANDDMLLNRPVTPDTFFAADGLPIIRFNYKPCRKLSLWFRQTVLKKKLGNYNLIIKNAADLVEKRYGVYFGSRSHHNIDAYLKSDYARIYEMFKDELTPTFTHHIRHDNDVQRHLYSYCALAEKRAHLQYVGKRTSFRLQIHERHLYKKLEQYNPTFLCMNDSQMAQDSDRLQAAAYLQERFPQKSQFEK